MKYFNSGHFKVNEEDNNGIQNSNLSHKKIMIIGGWDGEKRLANVEILDLDAGNWKVLKNLSIPRSYHCAVELNGKIYCLGGRNADDLLNDVERFDIQKDEWYKETFLNEPRECFTAVTYKNRICAFGGRTKDYTELETVETYDPRVGKWEYLPSMKKSRHRFGTVIKDNSIYAIGGRNAETVEIFDIRTNTWRYGPKLNFRMPYQVNAVISNNGDIFTIVNYRGREYLSVLIYNEWKSIISKKCISYKRSQCNLCIGSTVYSLGGQCDNENKILNAIETLDVTSINNMPNKYTTAKFYLKRPTAHFAAVVFP